MSIHVKIEKEHLNAIYKAASAIGAENVGFIVTDEGWSMAQADPSRVSMVSIRIPKESFLEYECTPGNVAIPAANLKSMLSVLDGQVEIFAGEDGRMTMKAGNIRRTTRTLAADESPKMPNLNLDVKATIDTTVLRKVISTSSYTDYISVKSSPNGITFVTSGDSDSTDLDIPVEGLPEASSAYPLDMFDRIVSSLQSPVGFEISTNHPCRIYRDEPFRIEFMLAPRIEEQRGPSVGAR